MWGNDDTIGRSGLVHVPSVIIRVEADQPWVSPSSSAAPVFLQCSFITVQAQRFIMLPIHSLHVPVNSSCLRCRALLYSFPTISVIRCFCLSYTINLFGRMSYTWTHVSLPNNNVSRPLTSSLLFEYVAFHKGHCTLVVLFHLRKGKSSATSVATV